MTNETIILTKRIVQAAIDYIEQNAFPSVDLITLRQELRAALAATAAPTEQAKPRPTYSSDGGRKCLKCGQGLLDHEGQTYCPVAAPQPQPAIPAGWKLVPIVPTEAMLAAKPKRRGVEAQECGSMQRNADHAKYAAMLAAAPPSPQQREDKDAEEAGPEFSHADPDLDRLLNSTAALLSGNANMDVGLMWMKDLEAIEARLVPTPKEPQQ